MSLLDFAVLEQAVSLYPEEGPLAGQSIRGACNWCNGPITNGEDDYLGTCFICYSRCMEDQVKSQVANYYHGRIG